jgi:hypothetical protein
MSARTRNIAAAALAAALLALAIAAPPAPAAFGLAHFDFTATNEDGSPATHAGSHPYAITTAFDLNYSIPGSFELPDGEIRNLIVDQVAGLIGDATAVPRCSTAEFFSRVAAEAGCEDDAAVGLTAPRLEGSTFYIQVPVYNLEPPPGIVTRLGFVVINVHVLIDVGVKDSGDHNIEGWLRETPQTLTVFGGDLELWGNPADPGHDRFRGRCGKDLLPSGVPTPREAPTGAMIEFFPGAESCPVSPSHPHRPFLTLPRSCTGPALTAYRAESWAEPGKWVTGATLTHDDAEPPTPQGFTRCGKLIFDPAAEARATTDSAETGTGFDFNLSFHDEGLKNPVGLAQSETKKAVVTLPEGMTVNPSVGEGLAVCTPADLDRETIDSASGEGCPNASKIGTVHTETPLVGEPVDGSVYLAQQDDPATTTPGAENPFDSLLALYIVLRNQNLGVLVKLPAKVEPDPRTGQLVTTLDNAPQFPVSRFDFHFREGQRAPLVSPPACGTYTTEAQLYPWSDPSRPRTVLSSFEIDQGVGGAPCPPDGVAPFHPHFEAGSLNNAAAAFSPFYMRLIRGDGEQDMTKFSSVLPPGVLGKLARVSKCPPAAIAAAKAKTGRQELANPSCPANSKIGRTLAGAGVGGALTFVPGKIFLSGPYKGAPLSVVSITAAVAGPFDAGAVVVQLGLTLNPLTAEVEVDGSASDPIPHILQGIPLKVRDLRVYVDRQNFILNPTSCEPSSAKATLFGGFLDVFSPADDVPVPLTTRYQAADCANLGFRPHLGLSLKGGMKRGGHPALIGVFRPRSGDANLSRMVLRLPRSAFLDQSHIRTICTRVQFAQKSCPESAVYGKTTAWSPLLDEPLSGPVYLRSSNNKLPDFVADLHGIVDVEAVARIDSAGGGIRATFPVVPDAPLTKVVVRMQGGKKGLIVNSRNLCAAPFRAETQMTGHNGRRHRTRPVVRPLGCQKQGMVRGGAR